MSYREILDNVIEKLDDSIKWWPRYLYHFTDVNNVPGILTTGWILSRVGALEKAVVRNDNASMSVINATLSENKNYGRLFFRPLTPTQYNNEGYKPEALMNENIKGSCPVPIFLCLDAVATLEYPDTRFAVKGISGSRDNIESGEALFSKLDFERIYHNSYFSEEDRDIKDYRQSEVIRLHGFPIEPLLKGIMCRSNAERDTLLFLLRERSEKAYARYENKISYDPKYKFFYNNGIFVTDVSVTYNALNIYFNSPEYRKSLNKDCSNTSLEAMVMCSYYDSDGAIIDSDYIIEKLDYMLSMEIRLALSIDALRKSKYIRCEIRFDDKLMYLNDIRVDLTEII